MNSQGKDGIHGSTQRHQEQDEEPRRHLDACIIKLGEGEHIPRDLADILDEVDIASIHIYTLSPENPAGLHYHDFDEYWVFMEGTTTVTLRFEGETRRYQVGPGDLVATPRGVEHGHSPQTPTRYLQFTSRIRAGCRPGHLERLPLQDHT